MKRTLLFALCIAVGATASVAQSIYEAENATLSGPVVANNNAGFTDTGFADYANNTGDYVEFTLSANSAGSYPIAFRYANGGTGDRPLELRVNGAVAVGSLGFPVTGGWTTWRYTATNSVPFNAGLNTVRITSVGSNGANVDHLLVTVNGTSSPPPNPGNTNNLGAPLRRPVSPSQPMWLVHIDTWNSADPQKIIDLIPADIRPYVVMNISLSISHNNDTDPGRFNVVEYGYETARSWVRTCAQNQMWVMIQPSSGGFSHFSDFDLSVYREFFQSYPNFLGFNYCEQFWGYDSPTDPLSAKWEDRIDHFANLLALCNEFGGYLVVSWCGNQWSPNINPIGMLKRVPAFAAACRNYTENFILCEKFTQVSYQSDMESLCLGAYLSGYAGQYGIRYDDTGWTDVSRTHTNFTMASAGAPHLEHMLMSGATVLDGPELIWQQCFRELSAGGTDSGFTMRRWDTFPQFNNVMVEMFRKLINGSVRIPTWQEVIDRTKIVIINNVNSGSSDDIYSSPATLYEGLYRMDGDGNLRDNYTILKKTGRYPAIPVVYQLDDAPANSFEIKVNKSAYAARWPTIASKVNEFNGLFPSEYTGDLYARRLENQWVVYNPFKVIGQTASASIPFKYNTCERMDLTFAEYTAAAIIESSNQVTFFLSNYDNMVNTALKTDTISIYGATVEPTWSFEDKGNHQTSVVTKSWAGGVFTLTVQHNGPIEVTVNCAGTAVGRLTAYTPATITPPARPLAYPGPRQYEGEHFDYKSIGGVIKNGYSGSLRNYTGQGYLNFGTSSSAAVRDHVTVDKTGVYRLETKYAVTGANISTIDLYVNGIKIATPVFAQTASLSDWALNKRSISLNAGSNIIEFRANGTGASAIYFDNMAVVPTAAGDGIIVQENSSGFGGVDGSIDSNFAGFTGTGFANTADTNGASIYWNLHFDSSAVKALTFRYASLSARTAELIVNGNNVASNLQFPSTGALNSWDMVTVYTYIPPGTSSVRLRSTSPDGLPNVDYLEVIGGGAETLLPTPNVEPVADAYVRDGGDADVNFGINAALVVNGSSTIGLNRRTYLKFDVSPLTGASSVKLKLTPQQVDGNASLTYELVPTDNWAEGGITWNNQPVAGTIIGNVSGYVAGQPIEIDVTTAATNQAAGDGILTLRIAETSLANAFIAFHSREQADASLRPVLGFQFPRAPGFPTNLIATAASSSEIDLSWSAVQGAVRYNVKRSANSGGPYEVIARNVSGLTYRDSSLPPGSTFYYVVTAVNNVGESDPSSEAVALTPPIPVFTRLPLADSYVRNGGFANNNFGTANNLTVKTDNGAADATRITYLKFNVQGLENAESAKLILTPSQVDGTSSLLYEVWSNDNWAETGVTWNNQPAGTGTAITTISSYTLSTPVMVDVTAAAQSQAIADGILTIRITKIGSDFVRIDFCSKEHTTESFRPVLEYVLPGNSAPALAAVNNRVIGAGATLTVTNVATDADLPAQTLAFSLLSGPENAAIDSGNGVITWRPLVTQANTTNLFAVRVADNGTPSLSATQSFVVSVTNLPAPLLAVPQVSGGQLILQVNGASGPDYQVEASSNLVDWSVVFTTNSPAIPFNWTNSSTELPMRFFRVRLGPPF